MLEDAIITKSIPFSYSAIDENKMQLSFPVRYRKWSIM